MTNHEAASTFATRATVAAATSHRRTDVTEVHHFFTAINRISYEGVGFAEQYGGCKIAEAEDTSMAGNYL